MASPAQPPPPQRGHARNKSIPTALRPRSSTKGPLEDIDDPLSQQPTPTPLPSSPPPPPTPSKHKPNSTHPRKDFSHLLLPTIYHPLDSSLLPAAYRDPSLQPPPDTPLQTLLERGYFRAAAIQAARELTSLPDPTDHVSIFDLLYIRLSSLYLIGEGALAAQESKVLGELGSGVYIDQDSEGTGENLMPWRLRVLATRLQAVGYGDWRRAVVGYFELAYAARREIAKLSYTASSSSSPSTAVAVKDEETLEVWKDRLHDLGIRIASALVEMDDLVGARELLKSIPDAHGKKGKGRVAMAKAMVCLQLGDIDGARTAYGQEKVVEALCFLADGEYQSALDIFEALSTKGQEQEKVDEMVQVNRAVCLLYLGRMIEGRQLLEGLVDAGYSSKALLFNLTTMYELCTERSDKLKTGLAEKMARMPVTGRGWDKMAVDFKL